MGVNRKIFLFFPINPANGNCYYVENNTVKSASILSKKKLWLSQSPDKWNQISLSFGRNSHYYGLNRSFSIPLKFVNDGAFIIRSLYYGGRGIETPLSLLILKWNDQTDIYELYYNGQMDLSKIIDDPQTGVTVNMMEGGINQLIKAYEKVIFEIPCDGSIPENIKANDDGLIQDDVFFYNITAFDTSGSTTLFSPLPSTFTDNEGDNVGVIHGDQTYEQETSTTWYKTSPNDMFSSVDPITIQINGSITVQADDPSKFARFQLKLLTSLSPSIADDTYQLLSHSVTSGYEHLVSTARTYHFSKSISLKAYENLFLTYLNVVSTAPGDQQLKVLGGSYNVQVHSRYNQTAIWGMTLRNLFKLVIQKINELSSTDEQTFDFGTISELLDANQNLFVTSGDAIRASGDTSYSKYFNLKNVDLSTGNVINTAVSYGPVIKTCLSDLFDAVNVILNAALGDDGDNIFIEEKEEVFNSSVDDMDLGEVSAFTIEGTPDYYINELEIGYEDQQFDNKAGKFEYNLKALWTLPVKSISQKLSLICPYIAASYLIEQLRANLNNTSTTENNSDARVFIINIDQSIFIFDFFKALFQSGLTDPNDSANTNQLLARSINIQSLTMYQLQGEYFLHRNDEVFFVFNQTGFSTNLAVALAVIGVLNGNPGDKLTLDIVVNGTVHYTQSWTVTGVNTPVSITGSIPDRVFNFGDVIWLRCTLDPTANADLGSVDLTVGSLPTPYFEAQNVGTLSIPQGSSQFLLALPNVVAQQVSSKDVVTYGFDYFLFNSQLSNSDFDYQFHVDGFVRGATGQLVKFKTYLNGVEQVSIDIQGDDNSTWEHRSETADLFRNFELGDVVFFVANSDAADFSIAQMYFLATSTIKAYGLKRGVYDSITGIPHPESAYNIEDLTPKRLFRKHSNYLRSPVFNLIPGQITFKTLSKNRFLQTTQGSVIYDEDGNEFISRLDPPLFYPFLFKFTTEVPDNFAAIMTGARNAHIKFSYLGNTFYGFPVEMIQKPDLHESQKWTLLASPKNNITDLINLAATGIKPLDMYKMFIPTVVGAKFVPMTVVKDPKYNFVDMDSDWFINQLDGWISKKNYFQKVQTSDTTPVQIRTNGLAPANLILKNSKGLTVHTYPYTPVVTDAISDEETLYTATIDWSIFAPGIYYGISQAGSGLNTSTAITEGFNLKVKHARTLLFEYTHRRNTQNTIFTDGVFTWSGAFRVEGNIVDFDPESEFSTFVDEPEDIDLLDGRAFRKFTLMLGYDDGIPDWVIDKLNAIMILSNVKIDGIQYTRDAGATKFDVTKFPGVKKKYWTIAIRPAKNLSGTTFDLDGGSVNTDVNIVATFSLAAFGAADTDDDELIDVEYSES